MRFFLIFISLIIFNEIYCQIPPVNDNCANALDIPIGQAGFQLGQFQSTQTDITDATTESAETFYSTIESAGQTNKTIWYKFSLPTARKCTFSLKQIGNGIQGNAAGFTVYLAKNCYPTSKQADDAMLASQTVFGSSTYPCMRPGDYLVQISALNSASGNLYVQLDLNEPEVANYDKPITAYNFGLLSGNRCEDNVEVNLGCYSIDNVNELCSNMNSEYTQSIWYTFTTDNYFDYIEFAYKFRNAISLKKQLVGFKIFKGNSRTQPLIDLQLIDVCNSDSLTPNELIYKYYSCNKLLTNTSYSIQIITHKNLTDPFQLIVQKIGTRASNGNKPIISAISPSNQFGILPNTTVTKSDFFACNTRLSANPCGNSSPINGVKFNNNPKKYNLGIWFTFELNEASNLDLSINYNSNTQSPLIRVFNKQGINCNDIDTNINLVSSIISVNPNQVNKIYCLPAGLYSLQVLGIEDFNTNYCSWENHFGQQVDLSLTANPVQVINRFSLNKTAAFDAINKQGNNLSSLISNQLYISKSDTVGCENTVLPLNVKCSPNANKAVYNEFQISDSGLVYLDVKWPFPLIDYPNWNNLYKGDANALTINQNKHLYPETFTGLIDYTKCFSNKDCSHIPTSCVVPGIYTHINYFDSISITKVVNTEYRFLSQKTKYYKPELAEDLGDILQKMNVSGNQYVVSQKDMFTCKDNPLTIDGLQPCDGANGPQQRTKLIYRQFYLSNTTLLRIIPHSKNTCIPNTYTLFSGKATNGVNALKRINSSWECTTDTLPCSPLTAGWYTVVCYGEGPSFSNPTTNYYGVTGAGGDVGSENYLVLTTTMPVGPKYNLPSKACVDSLTNQPFKLNIVNKGTLANPITDTLYTLYPEYFNCSVDTPFYKHPINACDSINYKRVVYYTINVVQESYLRLYNLPEPGHQNLICQLYVGNSRTNPQILSTNPIQPCVSGNYTEICRIQPGIYTLVIFVPDTYIRESIRPQIYIDKVGYSRHDFAKKAYDFGIVPGDNIWHKGKIGEVNPINTSLAPSNDSYYCTTGAYEIDPQDPKPLIATVNPAIYTVPSINNFLYSDTNPNLFNNLPRKNLWYTFVLKGGGNCTVRLRGLTPNKPNVTIAVYKSNVDGTISFTDVVINKMVDSTILQGLNIIGAGDNEVHFYRDVCSDFEERYYILAESIYESNHQVEAEILWEIDDDSRKGDYCSDPVVGEINQIGTINLSTNIVCHTIGESFGEDGSNMTCLLPNNANLHNYKSTWFRFDITGSADTFDIAPLINNLTNLPSDSIRYRLLYGSCGAMNNGSCFVSSSTINTFNCLIKGSYFLQVVSPTSYQNIRTEGIIEMNIKASPSIKKCSSVDPCFAVANFNISSPCTTDTVTFLNQSTAGDSVQYKWIITPYNQIHTIKNPKLVFPITNLSEQIDVKLVTFNKVCNKSDSITKKITVYQKPRLDLGKDTILCFQKTLALDITTHIGTSYLWYDGSTIPTRLISSNGNYFVQSTLGLCTVYDTLNVIVNPYPNPIVSLDPSSNPQCSNTSITLNTNASGNDGFQWQFTSNNGLTWNNVIDTIPFNGGRTNQLFISNVTGMNEFGFRAIATEPLNTCFTTSNETYLTIYPLPKVTTTTNPLTILDTIVRCQQDPISEIEFKAEDGTPPYYFTYSINNQTPITSNNNSIIIKIPSDLVKTETYKIIKIEDSNGCQSEFSISPVTIVVNKKPVFNFMSIDTFGCIPLSIQFKDMSIDGPYDSVLWNFGDGTFSGEKNLVSHIYQNPGIYSVEAKVDLNGCLDTLFHENYIRAVDRPIADFTSNSDEINLFNTEIEFKNKSTGVISLLEWDFGDNSPLSNLQNPIHFYPSELNVYSVILTAYTTKDCYDSKMKLMTVKEELLYYIPNTFTPNGDKKNDVFQPIFSMGFDPQNYTLYIFNRWGELIFESHDATIGWDGMYGKTLANSDTYTWEIDFKDKFTAIRYTETGHINLIK